VPSTLRPKKTTKLHSSFGIVGCDGFLGELSISAAYSILPFCFLFFFGHAKARRVCLRGRSIIAVAKDVQTRCRDVNAHPFAIIIALYDNDDDYYYLLLFIYLFIIIITIITILLLLLLLLLL
jgi:hypothetical protein